MSNQFSEAVDVLKGYMTKVTELTCDQSDVLYWVSVGYSDKKIASLRGTGVRTVEHHVSNIFKSFGLEQGEGDYNRRMVASQIYLMWMRGEMQSNAG